MVKKLNFMKQVNDMINGYLGDETGSLRTAFSHVSHAPREKRYNIGYVTVLKTDDFKN